MHICKHTYFLLRHILECWIYYEIAILRLFWQAEAFKTELKKILNSWHLTPNLFIWHHWNSIINWDISIESMEKEFHRTFREEWVMWNISKLVTIFNSNTVYLISNHMYAWKDLRCLMSILFIFLNYLLNFKNTYYREKSNTAYKGNIIRKTYHFNQVWEKETS